MRGHFALASVGALLAGAVLSAQPPADFEAAVKAAMAPSIARERVAVQKQVSTVIRVGAGQPLSSLSGGSGAHSSFFTTPFSLTEAGVADCDPLPSDQLESLIAEAAQKNGVDAQLVRAVIDQESAGRPCALSAKGAQGLMQLMPATAEDYDVEDPFDPKQNVDAGTKLLRSLLERYRNDPTLALGAYNAGSGRVDQEGGLPPIRETIDYVTAILDKLQSLHGETDGNTASAATSMKNSGWQTTAPYPKDF
jgi:soluble lytic murein transglycosylase-like protein